MKKIKPKNRRGEHFTRIKNKNLADIKKWFEENEGSNAECAKKLGLSIPTVIKRVKEINEQVG